ncbi:MAG: maleylpyruvate isomerase family mycothiol-dependent enzyme [Acidimicrobiales bacterium]
MAAEATVETSLATPLQHREAMVLAETEFGRIVSLLRSLTPEDWARPTVCALWDVRAMATHVLGMAEGQASFRQFAHDFRAASKRTDGLMIDAMTATQVRERTDLTTAAIADRLAVVAPKAVKARRRLPAPVRWGVRMKQDPPYDNERWKFGYLVDVIFTRDTWMHRVDICRATDRPMELTAEHDGRLIADVVAEWARRHGQPFDLTLTGPAGGQWCVGEGEEAIELDALDFCLTVGARAPGAGLLATEVPF